MPEPSLPFYEKIWVYLLLNAIIFAAIFAVEHLKLIGDVGNTFLKAFAFTAMPLMVSLSVFAYIKYTKYMGEGGILDKTLEGLRNFNALGTTVGQAQDSVSKFQNQINTVLSVITTGISGAVNAAKTAPAV